MPAINTPLSRYLSRKIKKLCSLSSLAKKFNLSVAKHENFAKQLIALDTVKRKLLLIRKEKDRFDCCVIDLEDVQHCSVKKEYGSIGAGELQTKGLSHYLQSISLQLGFSTGARPVAVSFYESRYHSRKQQSFLEAAARKWQRFVSELLSKPAPPKQLSNDLTGRDLQLR